MALSRNNTNSDRQLLENAENSVDVSTAVAVQALCRICAKDQQKLLHIFGRQGIILTLEEKIHKYLKIKVCRADGLPQSMCESCISILNASHDHAQLAQHSDIWLRQRFRQNQSDDPLESTETTEELMLKSEPLDFIPEVCYDASGDENECNDFDSRSYDSLNEQESVDQTVQQSTTNLNKQHKCPECETSFVEKSEVFVHCRKEHKSYLCEMCFIVFQSDYRLKKHQADSPDCIPKQKPKQKRKILNPVCKPKKIKIKKVVDEFEEYDIKNSTKCKLCPKTYFITKSLIRHYRKKHGRTLCPYCLDYYGYVQQTEKHCWDVHNDSLYKKREFICQHCGKLSDTVCKYKRHLVTHTPENEKLRCDLCQRTFFFKTRLKFHLLRHLNEARYTCSKCGKRFYDGSALAKHKTGVHAEKNIPCPHCDVKFKSVRSLRDHIKNKHETHWVYNCSVCDEGYLNEGDCLEHFHSHEELEKRQLKQPFYKTSQFECQICNTYFKSRPSFQIHMKRKHGIGAKDIQNHEKLIMVKNSELKSLQVFECKICPKKFPTKMQLRSHVKFHR